MKRRGFLQRVTLATTVLAGAAAVALAGGGVILWRRRRRSAASVLQEGLGVEAVAPKAPEKKDDSGLVGGKYQMTRVIGSGASGQVWEAHDHSLDRAVAVKRLAVENGARPELTPLPGQADEVRAQRLQVAKALASLSHPNVVEVVDIGRVGGFTEGMRIAALAQADNLSISPHTGMFSALNVIVATHFAAAAPNFLIFEFMEIDHPLMDIFKSPMIRPKNGIIQMPEAPGLGVELDMKKIAPWIEK